MTPLCIVPPLCALWRESYRGCTGDKHEGHRYGSVCTAQYGFFILQGFCGREKEKENVNNKNKTQAFFSQPAVFFLTAFSVIDGAKVLECLFNFDLFSISKFELIRMFCRASFGF